MKMHLEPADVERRQARALADDEDLELLTGFYRLRQWREKREAARPPDSVFARQLSRTRRSAILAGLAVPLALAAFVVAGESMVTGLFVGSASAIGGFLVLSTAASRHPAYSRPESLGDLVWTAGCGLCAAMVIAAGLLLVGLFADGSL